MVGCNRGYMSYLMEKYFNIKSPNNVHELSIIVQKKFTENDSKIIGLKGSTSNNNELSQTVPTLINYGNSLTTEYVQSNIPRNHEKEITISSLPILLTNFQLNTTTGDQNDIAGSNHDEKEEKEDDSYSQHTTTSEKRRS